MSNSIIKSWIRYWFYLGKWKFFKGTKPVRFSIKDIRYPLYMDICWSVWDGSWPKGVLMRDVRYEK